MAWRWISEGDKRGVAFDDGGFFELKSDAKLSAEDRNGFLTELATWALLYTARQAFATGAADYENAAENIPKLLVELTKAQDVIEKSMSFVETTAFGATFDRAFKSVRDRSVFVKELMEKLA